VKLLTINRKGILYEFRYLEHSEVVEISKDGEFTYLMRLSRAGQFICDCPGSRYRHKCWHSNMLTELFSQPEIREPWAEWAEEAGIVNYKKTRR